MNWSFLSKWEPQMLSVLRIASAFLFMAHGTQKLFGFPAGPQRPNRPPLVSTMGFGGLLEFVGGILLLFGLFTRPVAFVLSGLMAVAYFGWHASGGFWPILNRGELAVLYSFVFLYFVFAGGGPWSVDYFLRGRKS